MRVSKPDHQTQATTSRRSLKNSEQEPKQFPGLIIKLERGPKKGVVNNPNNTLVSAHLNQLTSIFAMT